MKNLTIAFGVGCLAGTLVNVAGIVGGFLALALFAAFWHWADGQEDGQ